MAAVLADTGALVALLDRSDRWHEWAVDSDFKVYRRNGRQAIPLIFPAA